MSEPFLAEIRTFSFGFAPRGWLPCDGQLLPITQYQSLFSLLGTTYGGDGRTTFALPDFRGRTPMHKGPSNQLGHKTTAPTVTLAADQIPAHHHEVSGGTTADANNPAGKFPGKSNDNTYTQSAHRTVTAMGAETLHPEGGGTPHDNMQPYTTLNICIAIQGIFPSRS